MCTNGPKIGQVYVNVAKDDILYRDFALSVSFDT